jgi:hypothetical protein
MGLDITGILTSIANGIQAVGGVSSVTAGAPVDFHLQPRSLDLQVPMLMDGNLNLRFLTKSVRFVDQFLPQPGTTSTPDFFGDYLKDGTKVIGGHPIPDVQIPLAGPPLPGFIPPVTQVNIAEAVVIEPAAVTPVTLSGPTITPPVPTASPVTAPLTPIKLPTIKPSQAAAEDLLSGVSGQIGQLLGTIPIPVLAPVTLKVTWEVQKPDGTAAELDKYAVVGPANTPDFTAVFAPAFEELTNCPPTVARFLVVAKVTVSVGSDSIGPIALPGIPVVVPAIGIPTVAALFNQENFGGSNVSTDNSVLVLVPPNSPFAVIDPLMNTLSTLRTAVNGIISGPFGTVSSVVDLVSLVSFLIGIDDFISIGGKPGLIVVYQRGLATQNGGFNDLSDVAYSSEDGDNFENELEGVLFIAAQGIQLKLGTKEALSGTTLTLKTGSANWLAINDLVTPIPLIPLSPMNPTPIWVPPTREVAGSRPLDDNIASVGFLGFKTDCMPVARIG